MAATAILNTTTHHPTAHLQIKYVSRLPDTRKTASIFGSQAVGTTMSNTPLISATVADNTSAKSWTLSTLLRNTSSTPQPQSVKVFAWPMFEPESTKFVSSGATQTTIASNQAGRIDIVVPKRELASFNAKTKKWVLEGDLNSA